MKSFACAYAIGTFHTTEKINVLNVKDLARSICDLNNGIQFQNELTLSGTF
jgi:hypothetical protein